jgi:outer membrane lipoprotein-sorting protein
VIVDRQTFEDLDDKAVNLLRRLPLSRLLLLCGLVAALGISITAFASAVGSGPTPQAKPLAVAVHDALTAPSVQGFSANVKLTNHLLEGVNLASGNSSGAGQLASSPLLSGASGRLWIAKDGRVRLELQAEKGDTQLYYDGHTVSLYDAASNTVYRYAVPSGEAGASKDGTTGADHHEAPSVAKIEEGISKLKQHANVSGATPSDVAGQPTYTVRVTPNEGGSLIGGAELAWDANNGTPLRAAIYSSTSSSPVIELAATDELSYGPVADSVFEFKPPAGAKIQDVKLPEKSASNGSTPATDSTGRPTVTHHGKGISGVVVAEGKQTSTQKGSTTLPEGLPQVKINGLTATELPTALGTLLSFERSGVRYVLGGFVPPSTIEAVARGL